MGFHLSSSYRLFKDIIRMSYDIVTKMNFDIIHDMSHDLQHSF